MHVPVRPSGIADQRPDRPTAGVRPGKLLSLGQRPRVTRPPASGTVGVGRAFVASAHDRIIAPYDSASGWRRRATGIPTGMFALIALICFVLALFGAHLGGIDLMILGLCFVALHLLFGSIITLPSFRRQAPNA